MLSSDVGNAIKWIHHGRISYWISSSTGRYNISTHLATDVEADGVTRNSTSTLEIANYQRSDAHYYTSSSVSYRFQCRVDYTSPIADEYSDQKYVRGKYISR